MTPLRRLAWPAFILYALVLFTATHWPQLRIDGPVQRTDLYLHLTAFGLWAALLIAAGPFRPRFTTRSILKLLAVAIVYAIIDESLQLIPALGRTFALDDLAANITGILIVGIAACVIGTLNRTTPSAEYQVPNAASPTPNLSSGVRTVSGFTALSRVFGLARDLITVRIFADTAVGSAFAAAFAIPNIFRRLFGEGALTAAFIPAYAKLSQHDQDRADRFATLVVGVLAIVTGALTIAAMAGIAILLAALERDANRDLSLSLLLLMLPYMPLICTAAILGGLLQTHGRFGPWAAAPIILNLCIIAVSIPYFLVGGTRPDRWAYAIGAAVLVSGVLQVIWSARCLKGLVHYRTGFAAVRKDTRDLLRRLVPALIGLGTLQLNSFLDTLIAMWPNWVGPTIAGRDYPLDEASNAILFYTQRLYQFPLGVFGIAVATVVFPELARRAEDKPAFARTLRDGIRLSLFIGLPASAGLAIVAPDLITTLLTGFGNGFSQGGADRATAVLIAYAAAVWAYSLNQVLTRAFYALGDTTTPMRLALATVALNLTLNLLLIWPMKEAGLAAATSIAATAQLVAASIILARRLHAGTLIDAATRAGITKAAAATVGMAVAVAIAQFVVSGQTDQPSWSASATALAVTTAVGLASYAALAAALRSRELRWLISRTPPAE